MIAVELILLNAGICRYEQLAAACSGPSPACSWVQLPGRILLLPGQQHGCMTHRHRHLSQLLRAQTYWPSEGAVFNRIHKLSFGGSADQNAKVSESQTEQFCCCLAVETGFSARSKPFWSPLGTRMDPPVTFH